MAKNRKINLVTNDSVTENEKTLEQVPYIDDQTTRFLVEDLIDLVEDIVATKTLKGHHCSICGSTGEHLENCRVVTVTVKAFKLLGY